MTRETDLAWCAGWLSSRGSLYPTKNTHKQFLRVASTNNQEAIEKFGRVFGLQVQRTYISGSEKLGWYVQIYGGIELTKIFHQLWPYLTVKRRKEFVGVGGIPPSGWPLNCEDGSE